MRLERHRAEEKAREHRPAVHHEKTTADQGGAKEAVLAVGGVDEDGGEGQKGREIESGQETAQDAKIGVAGRRQPRGQRPEIGRERQGQIDHQRGRWIVEGRIAELRAEHRLLRRPMRARFIGEVRPAVERQTRSRPKADEVGADRFAFAVEAAGTQGDPTKPQRERKHDEDAAVAYRPLAVEPLAVARRRRGRSENRAHVQDFANAPQEQKLRASG